MRISRREFAGALASTAFVRPEPLGCRLLDLGKFCTLPESLAGFSGLGITACSAPASRLECQFQVIAGAGVVPDSIATRLAAFVSSGGWLVFESGAGFGGFHAQREMLASYFGLTIEPPLDLWAAGETVPYIDYRWPVKTKVRDFSHVVPVSSDGVEIIGTAGGKPVAARRGTLIFLGSPIGPALLAGDREAHVWFSELVRAPSESGPLARFPVFGPRRSAT